MKKHLKIGLLFLAMTTSLASCLKDEDTTVLYSSQIIPDINVFMPHKLLTMMDNGHHLYYGDEPPRIAGTFYVDSLKVVDVWYSNDSITHYSPSPGQILLTKSYFKLHDQLKGILQCDYTSPRPQAHFQYDMIEYSRGDSTFAMLDQSATLFWNSPNKPAYFESNTINPNDFKKAYIIGNGDAFTIYFYDIAIYIPDPEDPNPPQYNPCPLVANIISGKLKKQTVNEYDSIGNLVGSTIEPYIDDFVWGKEIFDYYHYDELLNSHISNGRLAGPGDVWINNNSGFPVYLKSYNIDF